MLRKIGHRTRRVPAEQGAAYGMKTGPSLVKQIRAKKERERKRQQRQERREARRKRREKKQKH